MKYIITESQLEKRIYKFIDEYPDLQNLEQFDCDYFDWSEGVSVDQICFMEDEYDMPVIEYMTIPKDLKGYDTEDMEIHLETLPGIKLEDSLARTLYSLFEGRWKKPFKEWFKDKYGLEIKTFYD